MNQTPTTALGRDAGSASESPGTEMPDAKLAIAEAPSSAAPARGTLWRNRDYLAWLAADTSWEFGSAVLAFAMALITYDVTGSFAHAGAVATASTLAELAVTLPGGTLVDRWDRRTSLVVSGLLRAGLFAGAAVSWWTGVMSLPVLFAVAVSAGVVTGLFGTATNAALRSVVAGRDLAAATAANQGRDAAVSLGAGPISGALLAASHAMPFAVAAAGSLVQVLLTRRIRADLTPNPPTGTATDAPAGTSAPSPSSLRSAWRATAAGFAVLTASPLLRRLMPAIVAINAGLSALMTALQLTLRGNGVEPWRIGLLGTAAAAGMLVGAVVAPRLLRTVPTGRLTAVLFIGCALVPVPVSLSQSMPVALVSFAVLGVLMPTVNGGLGGYLQALIPGHLQGRALAAMSLVTAPVPAVMPALAGLGLETIGPGPTLAATAVFFPAAAAIILTNRELRLLPTPDRWDVPGPAASPS